MRRSVINILLLVCVFSSLTVSAAEQMKGLNPILSLLLAQKKFCDGPNEVLSAGQCWMDRNLGASRVATSPSDAAAYGDLYQWGRLADGHQSRTSPITSILSPNDVPGHSSFIVVPPSPPFDWRTPKNDNLWQGVAGINNPCPAGFRLPTKEELNKELLSWSCLDHYCAFASPLKLVLAGSRISVDGTTIAEGMFGQYWSSTVYDGGYSSFALMIIHNSNSSRIITDSRAGGKSVRCLKD